MNIVLLNDDHPVTGGNSVSNLTGIFAKSYRAQGHTVTVITSHRTDTNPEIIREEHVISLPISYRPSLRHYLSLGMPPVSTMLEKELTALKPDAVHAHNIHFYLTYDALRIARTLTPKVYITLHDAMSFAYGKVQTDRYLQSHGTDLSLSPMDHMRQAGLQYFPLRNRLIRKILHTNTRKVIAVSHALEHAAVANGISKVTTIHNGIDLSRYPVSEQEVEQFRTSHDLKGRQVILFGGRLSEEKGSKVILKALQQLKKSLPSVLLLVTGNPEKWKNLVAAANLSEDLSPYYHTTGWLSDAELRAAFSACHVVTTPSVYLDPFILMNIEAMAARKPVVGTIFGGTAEIIEHSETGFLCDPRDTQTYAGFLEQVLTDATLQKKMGEAGRKRAEKHFSAELMIEIYTQLLQE